MTGRRSLISFLWTPGRRHLSLSLDGDAEDAARRIENELSLSEEVEGRVAGRGVKIRRHPRKSAVKGILSTYFYAIVQEDGANCRLVGHFQWHPVGRIYAAAWMALSVLIPLAFLVVGALRGTPESTARDALPFLFPVLLPLLLTGMLYIQRRRDLPDEKAIRRWLAGLKAGWQEIETESAASTDQAFSGRPVGGEKRSRSMSTVTHLEMAELEENLDEIRRSPKEEGELTLIVRRPRSGEREVVGAGELSAAEGLVGDNWSTRAPGAPLEPERQLTLMNTRVAGLLAQDEDRWELFGDQLYIDLDLSEANLPVGTRLAMGEAVIEVAPVEHTGCKKFAERFGVDAVKFVSTPVGKELRLRGMYAKVVQPGSIRAGDKVSKL